MCFLPVRRSPCSFTSSFVMKSMHSGETLSKASSLKSYLPTVTLPIVSTSHSPANGDKPDTLWTFFTNAEEKFVWLNIYALKFVKKSSRFDNSAKEVFALSHSSIVTYSTYAMTPTLHMSVAYVIASKLTTSGATNSGVPNKTCNFVDGSYSRASPKSMILIRFPDSVRHKMFSG